MDEFTTNVLRSMYRYITVINRVNSVGIRNYKYIGWQSLQRTNFRQVGHSKTRTCPDSLAILVDFADKYRQGSQNTWPQGVDVKVRKFLTSENGSEHIAQLGSSTKGDPDCPGGSKRRFSPVETYSSL